MSEPKRAILASESTNTGTHVAADAPPPVDRTVVRVTAGLLFLAGGLFGLVKLYLSDFEGCRASGEGFGFHPLGWSSAMSFWCQYSWQSHVTPGTWQSLQWGDLPGATIFLVAGSLVLIACGVVCLVDKRIQRAGIVVGILLTAVTTLSCVAAFSGMAKLHSLLAGNWFNDDGEYYLCAQYLILLAVPVIFILVMTSTSTYAVHSRRALLIVVMAFGAVVFPVLSVWMNFAIKPEFGNILLVAALLVLAYGVRVSASAKRQADVT